MGVLFQRFCFNHKLVFSISGSNSRYPVAVLESVYTAASESSSRDYQSIQCGSETPYILHSTYMHVFNSSLSEQTIFLVHINTYFTFTFRPNIFHCTYIQVFNISLSDRTFLKVRIYTCFSFYCQTKRSSRYVYTSTRVLHISVRPNVLHSTYIYVFNISLSAKRPS